MITKNYVPPHPSAAKKETSFVQSRKINKRETCCHDLLTKISLYKLS